MPISRFLLPPFSRCSTKQVSHLLSRFGPSKRIQSCSYMKSNRRNYGNQRGHHVMPSETQAPRSWAVYAVPAAAIGFAGLAALVHYNDERRAVPKGEDKRPDSVTVQGPVIGGPFTLLNTENQVVTERNFRGNWVLLYFGYTSSPDVGPEQVQVMAKATDTLEKRNLNVLPVFVTIDPQRDTPPHLCAYIKEFDPRIMGLTGPVGSIRQMAQEYRVYYKKVQEEGNDYLVETSHNMYLINPNMEVVRCFGVEYNADELSEAIQKELMRSSS